MLNTKSGSNESDDALPMDDVQAMVRKYAIGFVSVSEISGIEDADCAGSGTLVSIGNYHGILSAAHVLEQKLPNERFGLVRFPSFGSNLQKMTVDMRLCRQFIIKGNEFSNKGPDIGFLILPNNIVGWLNTTNRFYKIAHKEKNKIKQEKSDPRPYFDLVVGVIGELTQGPYDEDSRTQKKIFNALAECGVSKHLDHSSKFDLLSFEPRPEPGDGGPTNYQGLSGGGLWRIFCSRSKHGTIQMEEGVLHGVAFYQSDLKNNSRMITCHGPISIYDSLATKVLENTNSI